MDIQMIQLNIPVPPAPILEQAVGYQSDRNARFLALWWEPAGDEAMVSDGFVTFTGNWSGYLAFVHHKAVYPYLRPYTLGSSDAPADYRLVVDLLERKAYIARCREAETVLAGQWESVTPQAEPVSLSTQEFEDLLRDFMEQVQAVPSMEEIKQRMERDQQAVESLICWLNELR